MAETIVGVVLWVLLIWACVRAHRAHPKATAVAPRVSRNRQTGPAWEQPEVWPEALPGWEEDDL